MLSQTELRVISGLVYIEGERVTVRELSDRLDWSETHTLRVVADLESKEYIDVEQRQGVKHLSLSFIRPVEEFVDLAREFEHVDFPDLVAGSALRILYYLDTDRTATELTELTGLSRATVYRRLGSLRNVGIVRKNHSRFALTDDFTPLAEFARAVATHDHRMEARTHGVQAHLIWESVDEYLFSCRSELTATEFHETGPGIFERHGVPLLTRDRNHYIRSERLTEVTTAELVCHTLLIDDGARYQSYCLLLITEHDIDQSTLVDVATHYDRDGEIGLADIVTQLCTYIASGGDVTTNRLPDWNEFEQMATEYEISL